MIPDSISGGCPAIRYKKAPWITRVPFVYYGMLILFYYFSPFVTALLAAFVLMHAVR